jgi:hypothetical protein
MEEKEARRRPGVKVMGEETPEEKKESVKAQWRMMEELAQMKMYINFMRSTISPCRWERAWASYVGRVWIEETPVWEWGDGACVYALTIPYSRQEYLGESKIGPFQRWKGHLSKALMGGKQAVYKMMDKMNAYKCVLTPLYMWGRMTTKVERLKEEGRLIWERNAKMNMKGTQHGGDFRAGQVHVLFGGRTRHRQVIRRRGRAGEKTHGGVMYEEKEETGRKKADREAHMRGVAVRLGRRPWKMKEIGEGEEHKTMGEVRRMKESDLKMLIRTVIGSLDGTTRNIARTNVRRILANREDIKWIHLRSRSVLMDDRRVKVEVEKEIRRWLHWKRRNHGVMVIVEHHAVQSATKSMLQMLNNTEEKAKTKREELR